MSSVSSSCQSITGVGSNSSNVQTTGASTSSAGNRLLNPPAFIESKGLRFLVMDAPSDNNLLLYMKEMERYHVSDVVRACGPTYSKEPLEKKGIHVHELNFKDGDPPPNAIISDWLNLVHSRFKVVSPSSWKDHSKNDKEKKSQSDSGSNNVHLSEPAIAVHCVAGLGRAPVLVAIALIEFCSMPALEAIEFIRKKRRGAFNSRQIQFLDTYKRRGVGKSSDKEKNKNDKCVIM